jgi:glucuronokinase
MWMEIIRTHGFARAGLIGNPSDGYHGKTISIIVREFRAEVILYEWERLELVLSQEDQSRFDSIGELARDVRLHGYYGGIRLVKATIKKFIEYCDGRHRLHDRNFSVRYESNIPRCVGLAGSSAIIVATLRALMRFYDVQIPLHLQPSLALSVETEELGITAGLQDRVIQVHEGMVYMDFARGSMREENGYRYGVYERMDPALLPPLYIALQYRGGGAHRDLAYAVASPLRTGGIGSARGHGPLRTVGIRSPRSC